MALRLGDPLLQRSRKSFWQKPPAKDAGHGLYASLFALAEMSETPSGTLGSCLWRGGPLLGPRAKASRLDEAGIPLLQVGEDVNGQSFWQSG